jgi:hypothetical protein
MTPTVRTCERSDHGAEAAEEEEGEEEALRLAEAGENVLGSARDNRNLLIFMRTRR